MDHHHGKEREVGVAFYFLQMEEFRISFLVNYKFGEDFRKPIYRWKPVRCRTLYVTTCQELCARSTIGVLALI